MHLTRLLRLLVASSVACAAAVGCAAEDADSDETGDDDVVSARQLNGSDMPDKTISLTLDDGPGDRTGELADYLSQQGIKGTFFINGKNALDSKGKAAIAKIVGGGHILANHTHNHKQLTRLSAREVESEVAQTDAIIARAQPNGPFIVRAPFGAWSASIANTLNGGAMKKYVGSVFWDEGGDLTDRAAADWACWGRGVSVQRCGELYVQEIRAKRRGIILMHDIHGKTVDMIKQIVPILKADGYKFVGVDEAPSVKRAIAASGGVSPATGPEGEGDPPATRSCTVSDPDGFTNFREAGADSALTATVNNGSVLEVLGTEGSRTRVLVDGWVNANLTSCGSAAECPPTVAIRDPQPAVQGQASGTNMRAEASLSSRVVAVAANGSEAEVLEREGNRIHVRLPGTVGSHLCR
jgi:peptidoglycan/xylan/chitin deacetylase (PgdA/CDA1 family)